MLWVLDVLVLFLLFTGHPRNLDSAEKSGDTFNRFAAKFRPDCGLGCRGGSACGLAFGHSPDNRFPARFRPDSGQIPARFRPDSGQIAARFRPDSGQIPVKVALPRNSQTASPELPGRTPRDSPGEVPTPSPRRSLGELPRSPGSSNRLPGAPSRGRRKWRSHRKFLGCAHPRPSCHKS